LPRFPPPPPHPSHFPPPPPIPHPCLLPTLVCLCTAPMSWLSGSSAFIGRGEGGGYCGSSHALACGRWCECCMCSRVCLCVCLYVCTGADRNTDATAPLVSVESIVREHWSRFGRNYYTRWVQLLLFLDATAANAVGAPCSDDVFTSVVVALGSVSGSSSAPQPSLPSLSSFMLR
jgi:hypothetical protein